MNLLNFYQLWVNRLIYFNYVFWVVVVVVQIFYQWVLVLVMLVVVFYYDYKVKKGW